MDPTARPLRHRRGYISPPVVPRLRGTGSSSKIARGCSGKRERAGAPLAHARGYDLSALVVPAMAGMESDSKTPAAATVARPWFRRPSAQCNGFGDETRTPGTSAAESRGESWPKHYKCSTNRVTRNANAFVLSFSASLSVRRCSIFRRRSCHVSHLTPHRQDIFGRENRFVRGRRDAQTLKISHES